MASDNDIKRLERQARALILSKDISLAEKEQINSIMRRVSLSPDEKYSSIIKLIKNAPDKEIADIPDDEEGPEEQEPVQAVSLKPATRRARPDAGTVVSPLPDVTSDGASRHPDINGPTDTKLFISEIYDKYRKYKLFKKRYLVENSSWIGIGLDRRLIPTKKFLMVMRDIQSFQERVLSRLGSILDSILGSETVEGPLEYNYIRSLRRWLFNMPFSDLAWQRIKWMDHWGFERELRKYVSNYHSFLRMPQEHRERVLAMIEGLVREMPDLLKEEVLPGEERSVSVNKEKSNYEKEKTIYEYMGAVRSFMTIPGEGDSLLAGHLAGRYDVPTLGDFINMTMESIVFQRPFAISELRDYYDIRPMIASSTLWDCNVEKLRLYNKDPESQRRRHAEKLKSMLVWYDMVHSLVSLEEAGRNILLKAADEQWKLADRVNRDAAEYLDKNFIVFLEALVHYFVELMLPVLAGGEFAVLSAEGEFNAAMFTHEFFAEEVRAVELMKNEFYRFRDSNPTLKVSGEEAKKIMGGKIPSMAHVEKLIFSAGSAFYGFASRLHMVYDGFLSGDAEKKYGQVPQRPLSPDDMDAPFIPYAGCVMKSTVNPTPHVKKIEGRRILSDNRKSGVYIYFMAYCYQAANLCGYPKISEDLGRRNQLRKELNLYKGEGLAGV